MLRSTERPPCFRDGKKRNRVLMDILLSEIAFELANRSELMTGARTAVDASSFAQVEQWCLRLVANPQVDLRLRRLERTLSDYWLDPSCFVNWPRPSKPIATTITIHCYPQPLGCIAGTYSKAPSSSFSTSRFSGERISRLAPLHVGADISSTLAGNLPVGAVLMERASIGGLGRFDVTNFAEAME